MSTPSENRVKTVLASFNQICRHFQYFFARYICHTYLKLPFCFYKARLELKKILTNTPELSANTPNPRHIYKRLGLQPSARALQPSAKTTAYNFFLGRTLQVPFSFTQYSCHRGLYGSCTHWKKLKQTSRNQFLAHLWGAYAIPMALSGVRRPSYVVCRLCPP